MAQWLEHPTRSPRVVGSDPIWSSDFFSEFPIDAKTYHVVISTKDSFVVGWLHLCCALM